MVNLPSTGTTEWTGFRWPVYRMTIVPGVWDRDVRDFVPPKDHPLRRFMPPVIPPSGIFFPEGATVHPVAKALLGRVPVEGRHGYNLVACGEDLLQQAIKVDVASSEALTAFVNTWGRLGVGLSWRAWRPGREGEHSPAELGEVILESYRRELDSVDATSEALLQLQQFVRWLTAIQRRDWRAAGIPKLDNVWAWAEAQLALCGLEERLAANPSPRDYPKLHMLAFANWVTQYLEGVHPTLRWDPDVGPVSAWIVRSPIEMLWVTLWHWATDGRRIRHCRRPKCPNTFPAEHANKHFCSHECAAKVSAARWYRTKGRKLRQQQRKAKGGLR
jgi:hypothetical protein